MGWRLPTAAAAVLLAALVAAPAASARPAPVLVAYAGSLQYVEEEAIGPLFQRTTGIPYEGQGGGAFGLAQEILGGVVRPDVFLSLTSGPWELLHRAGKSPYAVGFAASPLVVAYNPKSRFAPEFRRIAAGRAPLADLWRLLAKPGLRLGRTNPDTDPQGRAFVLAVRQGVRLAHLPPSTAAAILGPLDTSPEIFAEEAVLSRLQGGQLDAASAFLPEARERHLPYVALPPALNFADPKEAAAYARWTLRLPNGTLWRAEPFDVYVAPLAGRPEAARYVRFTLSTRALRLYAAAGYRIIPEIVLGRRPQPR